MSIYLRKRGFTSGSPESTFDSAEFEPDDSEAVLDSHGFTLIEVLVSMILVSMITLIMAFALRVNLQAWERGIAEGDKVQIEVVLPHMLERQLRSIISNTVLAGSSQTFSASGQPDSSLNAGKAPVPATNPIIQTGTMTQLQFSGKENMLSFYTLYSPQGTPSQGLVRVAYLYDHEAKELTVYEKVIGSQEDISESENIFSISGKSGSVKSGSKSWKSGKKSGQSKSGGNFSGLTAPVATITDVEEFSLSFLGGEDSTVFQESSSSNPFSNSPRSSGGSFSSKGSSSLNSSYPKMDAASFKDTWDENASEPPGFIRLLFAQTKRRSGTPSVWLFKVGGKI
ncbi:MAG: prepilin-type N-terminal cleavage/methylation domain-containing protein [Desulfamplus sp.]|nr:prepilin-type N-terminal cleavage/methylation domain-containing protein [Desulfamplus sp.]